MKGYFITSALPGATVNKPFFETILNYCAINNYKLVIIPLPKISKDRKDKLDPSIKDYLIHEDLKINKNITASVFPIKHLQVDPVTGMARFLQKEGSVIYGSPKQRLKSVGSPKHSLPRVLMTTGSITNTINVDTKAGIIANKDHVFGGVIVEVENSAEYHYRHVSYENGFIDLGIMYYKDQVKPAKTEAIIPGDWHYGFTDLDVRRIVGELISELKPKKLVIHDFFDGVSISHHFEGRLIQKANAYVPLKVELMGAATELKQLENALLKSNKNGEVLIVKSNHDEFLDRWLDSGKFMYEPENMELGLELGLAKKNGKDPLEVAFKKYHNFKSVKFLKNDESYKLTKKEIEVGCHGHLGINGAKGSTVSLEVAYGNIVFGHTHSPEILRGAMCVGTSTHLKLSYNKGPSSWMQTLCVVYANGQRQLINVINKRYRPKS